MDLNEWQLVHKVTGEIVSLDILMVQDGGQYNKVFLREFGKMIGCTGSGTIKVLKWVLDNKNNKNELHGTQREIAEELGMSTTTVNKVVQALTDNGFLRQVRSGTYLVNPYVMHYGGAGNRIAILKIWENLK